MNFRSFGNEQLGDGGGGRQPGSFGLVRQSSIYSLTFDEFQSTMGSGIGGKDFGSMNMDELLKNIWSAEENQTVGSGSGGQANGAPIGHLQRQGSLTLPRTLSQKTVDEVWKDILKEYPVEKNGSGVGGSSNMPQRQHTLGEMTLEEFLSRAGVVREDTQMAGQINNAGVFGDMSQAVNNTGLGFAFQQAGQNAGLMGSRILENNSEIGIQSANLLLNMNGARPSQQHNGEIGLRPANLMLNMNGARPSQQHNREVGIQSANLVLNMNGARPSQPQFGTSQLQQHQQKLEEQQQDRIDLQQHQQQQQNVKQQKHQQLLFLKQQQPFAYGGQVPIPPNGQLHSNGLRGQVMGISDGAMNGNLIQGSVQPGGAMGMVGLGAGGVTVATGSPAVSSDGLTKSNGDTSSVSPIPYALNGSMRGRKNSALEKVVERRQRRMIKNRESAARSRARKQAYTTELEQEVAKLKEENKELRKKQAEMLEVQKKQVLEMMNLQRGAKRQCLRRTQTGPW